MGFFRWLADVVRTGTKESTMRVCVLFSVVVPTFTVLSMWVMACLWNTPGRIVLVPLDGSIITFIGLVGGTAIIGKLGQNWTENQEKRDACAKPVQ